MNIKVIAAVAHNNGIGGEGGEIPWAFHPQDMRLFSVKTKSEGGVVVMGRKTFLSLPELFRPLPDRRNIVLTRNKDWKQEGVEVFNDKESMLLALSVEGVQNIWVCGGAEVYKQFIDFAEELHISLFDTCPESAIAFFPNIDHDIWEEQERNDYSGHNDSPRFTHYVYKRKI